MSNDCDVIEIETAQTLVTMESVTDVVETPAEVTEILHLAEQGPPGIQGPPGPAGGAAFEHSQEIAQAVWTVAHNLSRHPAVVVTDHLGNLVAPDIRYLDDNIVQVSHGTPLTGFVYCN